MVDGSEQWQEWSSTNMSNQAETNWDLNWKTHLYLVHRSVDFNRGSVRVLFVLLTVLASICSQKTLSKPSKHSRILSHLQTNQLFKSSPTAHFTCDLCLQKDFLKREFPSLKVLFFKISFSFYWPEDAASIIVKYTLENHFLTWWCTGAFQIITQNKFKKKKPNAD